MKNSNVILLCIIVLAALLRFWQIGTVPLSPDWDEAALGYNAYSILHTGKDEYGQFLPIVLRSFDDYKPALYAYLAVPFLAIFDLSVAIVRLPSAIFGVFAVVATYFLVKELVKREDLALLTAFLLAISPWHIQFSRAAFEANIGLTLNICAALFFLKGLRKTSFLFASAVCSGLCLYTYQSEKIFTPLFILLLLFIYKKEILSVNRKNLISSFIVGILITLPMFFFILTNHQALSRAKETSIFGHAMYSENLVNRMIIDNKNSDLLGLLIDNKKVLYIKSILSGYLVHFDLNWLFITGDIARHHATGMGLLYLWELPFLLIGLYILVFSHKIIVIGKQSRLFLLSWFLIAPVPAALTIDVPHAIRTLNFLPTFQIFIATGILCVYFFLKEKKSIFRYSIYSLCLLFFVFNSIFFLNQYFIQQNYFNGKDWQYGYEQLVPKTNQIKNMFSKVVISNKSPMDQSYIFFLFYEKYPPEKYQEQSNNSSDHNFDKFEFRTINWGRDQYKNNTLFIGTPSDFPQLAQVKTISYPNNQPAMEMIKR